MKNIYLNQRIEVIKKKYPKICDFILNTELDNNYYFLTLRYNNSIMNPLEHFLGLNELKGFDGKLDEIKRDAIKTHNNNEGSIKWYSICAELHAIYIIGEQLGYKILGFEQRAPKAISGTCDIKAKKNSNNQFFEVKCKCSQTAQGLPKNLWDFLVNFKSNFILTARLNNRKYQYNNFEDLKSKLIQHIESWESSASKAFPNDVPPPYQGKNLTIYFFNSGISGGCFFRPDCIESIHDYLFNSNSLGKNGEYMIPMVSQAEQKGADYLCCKIPDWDDYNYDQIMECSFEKYKKITPTEYETTDKKMKRLKGIILFSRYDKYCIINRSRLNTSLKNLVLI
ncbi:MAG: hypothetical protein ISS80_00265 [Candidatus Cloacimonetes bacterium]|nr:hypothetical protein [Candidatus Cloacimonadota bacterium]